MNEKNKDSDLESQENYLPNSEVYQKNIDNDLNNNLNSFNNRFNDTSSTQKNQENDVKGNDDSSLLKDDPKNKHGTANNENDNSLKQQIHNDNALQSPDIKNKSDPAQANINNSKNNNEISNIHKDNNANDLLKNSAENKNSNAFKRNISKPEDMKASSSKDQKKKNDFPNKMKKKGTKDLAGMALEAKAVDDAEGAAISGIDSLASPLTKALSGISSAAKWTTGKVGALLGSVGKLASGSFHAVVGVVNGAINSTLSFLGSGLMVTSSLPTIFIATSVVSGALLLYPPLFHNKVTSDCQVEEPKQTTVADVSNADGVGGNWTVNGTAANKVAKEVFEYWTHKGFSGAGAAGTVGNVGRESNFDPTIVQGGGHSDNPASILGAIGTNGYGLYQVSPGSKYGTWTGFKQPTPENESDYMWEAYGGARINNGIRSSSPDIKKKLGDPGDPLTGAQNWMIYVEMGSLTGWTDDRGTIAKKAYDLFGGSSIQFNDNLLNGAADTADSNSATAALHKAKDACPTDSSDSDAADGTGSVKEKPGKSGLYIKYGNVPADMQQFIHDPKEAGLSFGSASGWVHPGGQCVDFSISYFHNLWKGAPSQVSGNGKDTAGGFASAMGGSLSSTPHAGAVCSVPPEIPDQSPGPYGHTFIVEHVLANGDIILAEQNIPGYSGDENGTPCTWNYRLLSKDTYTKDNFQFFTPDKSKYHFSWSK